MGQLKKAFMEIIQDDMGGGNPVDKGLVEDMLKVNQSEVEVGLILHSINSDISRLSLFKGYLSSYKVEVDILVARLSKLAERL